MGRRTSLERAADKSPSHLKGWRTRRRNEAAEADHQRVLATAHELRRQMPAHRFHTTLPELAANTKGN